MKRNWLVISQLTDYYTKIAISLATDPNILAGFQRGFPFLFLPDLPDEADLPLCLPLSALKEAAAKAILEEGNKSIALGREFCLTWAENVAPHLRFPVAPFYFIDIDPMPQGIIEQFVGQKLEAGIKIRYLDVDYIVACCFFSNETVVEEMIGQEITEPPELYFLRLVRAEFIDLDG